MHEYLDRFKKALKDLYIRPNDILYIASDISLFLYYTNKNLGVRTVEQRNIFLNNLIDILQKAVGNKGTLLFPIFTWRFCKGEKFDYKNTKGETGTFSNWILENRPDFIRTKHPIYSFMVWGIDAVYLRNLNNKDSWSDDSPFAYLHQKNAKLLLLNVSLQRSFTFMHYVEEKIRVPYRYMKEFVGSYVDESGLEEQRKYSMYVRDLQIESHEYLPETFLTDKEVSVQIKFEKMNMRSIELAKAYKLIEDDLLNKGGENCYKFHNYKINWMNGATHHDQISD